MRERDKVLELSSQTFQTFEERKSFPFLFHRETLVRCFFYRVNKRRGHGRSRARKKRGSRWWWRWLVEGKRKGRESKGEREGEKESCIDHPWNCRSLSTNMARERERGKKKARFSPVFLHHQHPDQLVSTLSRSENNVVTNSTLSAEEQGLDCPFELSVVVGVVVGVKAKGGVKTQRVRTALFFDLSRSLDPSP